MELAKKTHNRIFAAADSLYEQAGRSGFPTVDAVRKIAKVNMNDASAGMKEWRRAQTAQAASMAVQVPEAIQQANSAALNALWQEAQELANESLRSAQVGWDAERIEANILNKQISDAYEVQAAELNAAQDRIIDLEAAGKQAAEEAEAMRQQLAIVKAKAEAAQEACYEQRNRTASEAQQMAERMTAVQAECEHARKDAGKAREDAAALRGQLNAIKEQNAQLFQTIKAQSEMQPTQDQK